MHWNIMKSSDVGRPRFQVSLAAIAVAAITLSGCSRTISKNCACRQVAGHTISTPSADVARAASVNVVVSQRDYPQFKVAVQDGAVTHGPLYFEDPYEDHGSEDGEFAVNDEDYFQICYSRVRFLANALLLPLSAVIDPPWVTMVSDGHVGRREWTDCFDARRLETPCASRQAGENADGDSAG